MEQQDYFTSFEEMKNSSLPVEPNSPKSQERRERFSEAMHFFRNEYLQSLSASKNIASTVTNTVNGLH